MPPTNLNLVDPNEKRDWKKLVNDSRGTMVFVPDKFRKESKELDEERAELNHFINDLAQKDIVFNMKNQNLLLEIRKYLAASGNTTIWTKDIGWNPTALNDNEFVINIMEPSQRRA